MSGRQARTAALFLLATLSPCLLAGDLLARQCIEELVPQGVSPQSSFGTALALDDDTLAVSAPGDDEAEEDAGAVLMFERDAGGPGQWGQVAKVLPSQPADDLAFGLALALDSDTLAVGAPFESLGNLQRAGAVYIHERDAGDPGSWGHVQRITAFDPNSVAEFGTALALEGDTLLVGSPGNNDAGPYTGAVYVYGRGITVPGEWGFVRKLHASDLYTGDRYGTTLALSGDHALIGAPWAESLPGVGKVYVVRRNPGGSPPWVEVRILESGTTGIRMGGSLSIEGDLAVCAGEIGCGVGLFARHHGGSDQWGLLTRVATTDFLCSGSTVRLRGDRLTVGDARAFRSRGAIFVFERDHGGPGEWGLAQRVDDPLLPQDRPDFGVHLAEGPDVLFVASRPSFNEGEVHRVDLDASRRYCSTSPNSVGPGAYLTITGSTNLSLQNLVLIASGGPPAQFGLFYYGPEEATLPFGNGLRCVAGGALGLFRASPPLQLDAEGAVEHPLDPDAPPSPAGTIRPGSTWNFQFWYRDPAAGGAGFNLSDAFALSFCP